MGRSKIIVLVVMVSVLSLIYGCATFMEYGKLEKSARQNYQRGDYDLAVFDCVAALKLKPDYGKAQALIKDAYKVAVDAHESKIKELKLSSAKFKWDSIVSEYEALSKLNQAIKGLPTLRDKKTNEVIRFDVTDYAQDLAEAKTNAAEAHYQEGIRLSQSEKIDLQKQAAKEFKEAERFSSGYKDAADLYERARRAGIKRMAIIPFEDKSGKEGKYGALSDMIVDEVISEVINDPSTMEFLEIISRDQLERVLQEQDLGQSGIVDGQTAADLGKVLGVHEILTGKITQIIYRPATTTSRSERRKSREVTGKEKYTDSSGKVKEKNVYGDVYATVKIYTRKTSASIAGSYKIIDAKTARVKRSESFTEADNFECKWATYSGDERALNRNDKTLAGKIEEPAPVEEEIVNQAAMKLATSLAKALKDYAR